MPKYYLLMPLAALLMGSSAAYAETTLDQLMAKRTQLRGKLQINLTLKGTIEAESEKANKRMDGLNEERVILNGETDRSNGYCQGQFEAAELRRRSSECGTWQSRIDADQTHLDGRVGAVEREMATLKRRDGVRVRQAEALWNELQVAEVKAFEICSRLHAAVRPASCGAVMGTGAAAAALGEQQSMFDKIAAQCANLLLEEHVECERQVFDGNVYDPARPVIPDPY
jgi:hypothetical protein